MLLQLRTDKKILSDSSTGILLVSGDCRPALICDDIENLQVTGLQAQGIAQTPALLWLQNCREGLFRDSKPQHDVPVFLKIAGENSQDVALVGNHLKNRNKPMSLKMGQ